MDLFTLENLFTLIVLIFLQAVLGFDNLLYISIESKRVENDKQSHVRRVGIGLAIFLRIALLIVLVAAIGALQSPFFKFGMEQLEPSIEQVSDAATQTEKHTEKSAHNELGNWELTEAGKYFAIVLNVHAVIVLLGGFFIIYTAFKEIFHMLSVDHIEHDPQATRKTRSVNSAIFWIVAMNLVFSFDSILSAIALTENVWVMATAIIISGVLMILLADTVANFLKRNRMFEVLGLFILLIVGVMLVTEGGHLAKIHLFASPVEAMSKSTFYFVIFFMIAIDVVQTRYQKKLMSQRKSELDHTLETES